MPVVIKEAMAVGVPVVATDEVGNPEMVDDEVGRLVPPADPAALAGAIAELATLAPDERRSIGLAARRRAVERFELRSEVAKLIDIFDGVVAARTGRLSRGRASPE
jgi:glycosyltransferase involved in cell wall biosynthesis